MLLSEVACAVAADCSYCSSDLVRSACYPNEEAAVLSKVPGGFFDCAGQPSRAPPVKQCTDTDEASCKADDGCVWCASAAVGASCYTEAEAKKLPAAIFDCSKRSLTQQ
ncbi:hypothetical protein WJX72_009283 [[Myrmecia] bisecta]|uniref:Uncharacterized protein n=1 Tax=[Myrmecia] bisecta TaxID=41462 RepID=A0AAW1R8A8_9CHLO